MKVNSIVIVIKTSFVDKEYKYVTSYEQIENGARTGFTELVTN